MLAPAACTVPPPTLVQVVPLGVLPRFAVRSTLPLFALPAGGRSRVLRPLPSVPAPVTAVSQATRFTVKLLICTLLLAIEVQLSAVLVINPSTVLVGGLVYPQYCASTCTGSGTSCEPLAFLSASRPKRIDLPELNAMPLPALAVPKRAGFVAYATLSASITSTARLISALKGATGVNRLKKTPVPEPNVRVPVPPPLSAITGSMPVMPVVISVPLAAV